MPPAALSAGLELNGLPVLVCGGGPAALSAIRGLLDSRAVVTVVAPEIAATVAELAACGLLIMRRRRAAPDDSATPLWLCRPLVSRSVTS